MNRDELLGRFYIDQMISGIETITELDHFCWKERDLFRLRLETSLTKLTDKIRIKQMNLENSEIFSISLCFFRSKYHSGEGSIRIYAFDKRFFLDPDPVWEDMDITPMNRFIWALEAGLIATLSDYNHKVMKSDVHRLIQLEYIPYLIEYLTELARNAVRRGCADCLQSISITDDFCITVGEYQGNFDEIFVMEEINTSGVELGKFLNNRNVTETELFCKRYKNEILREMDLSGINFTKCHFDKVEICNSKLDNSILLKTEWINCRLVDNSWKDSCLFDAYFCGSDLTGSDFSGINAPKLPPSLLSSAALSWHGINFMDTNLECVKFAGADMRGADFRGAKFHHTDFSDAVLDEAVFDQTVWSCVEFTEEQKKQIKVEE